MYSTTAVNMQTGLYDVSVRRFLAEGQTYSVGQEVKDDLGMQLGHV